MVTAFCFFSTKNMRFVYLCLVAIACSFNPSTWEAKMNIVQFPGVLRTVAHVSIPAFKRLSKREQILISSF